MCFTVFVLERQAVHVRRQRGLPRVKWTSDPILQHARFCCIDRRDDAVTKELLSQLPKLISRRQRILLAASLRFTSSRRGAAAELCCLVVAGGKPGQPSALVDALRENRVACGTGTYQMTLNRQQIAARVEQLASEVDSHVAEVGPLETVLSATG